jgi:hypothetical protein
LSAGKFEVWASKLSLDRREFPDWDVQDAHISSSIPSNPEECKDFVHKFYALFFNDPLMEVLMACSQDSEVKAKEAAANTASMLSAAIRVFSQNGNIDLKDDISSANADLLKTARGIIALVSPLPQHCGCTIDDVDWLALGGKKKKGARCLSDICPGAMPVREFMRTQKCFLNMLSKYKEHAAMDMIKQPLFDEMYRVVSKNIPMDAEHTEEQASQIEKYYKQLPDLQSELRPGATAPIEEHLLKHLSWQFENSKQFSPNAMVINRIMSFASVLRVPGAVDLVAKLQAVLSKCKVAHREQQFETALHLKFTCMADVESLLEALKSMAHEEIKDASALSDIRGLIWKLMAQYALDDNVVESAVVKPLIDACALITERKEVKALQVGDQDLTVLPGSFGTCIRAGCRCQHVLLRLRLLLIWLGISSSRFHRSLESLLYYYSGARIMCVSVTFFDMWYSCGFRGFDFDSVSLQAGLFGFLSHVACGVSYITCVLRGGREGEARTSAYHRSCSVYLVHSGCMHRVSYSVLKHTETFLLQHVF